MGGWLTRWVLVKVWGARLGGFGCNRGRGVGGLMQGWLEVWLGLGKGVGCLGGQKQKHWIPARVIRSLLLWVWLVWFGYWRRWLSGFGRVVFGIVNVRRLEVRVIA